MPVAYRIRNSVKWCFIALAILFGETCTTSSSSSRESDGGVSPPTTRSDGAALLYTPASPASAQNAQFSPDGQTLLFTLFHNGYNAGPAGLFKLSLATLKATPLFDEPDHDAVNFPSFGWNATAGRIAFASDRQDKTEIWTISSDGSDPRRVTHHDDTSAWQEPSFSPNGNSLAFEIAPASGNHSIASIHSDGTGLAKLTDSTCDDRQPNWSPHGDRLVFQRRCAGDAANLFTIVADGSDVRPVTTPGTGDHSDATFMPDGRIVFSSTFGGLKNPKIFIIAAGGGTPTAVTRAADTKDYAPSPSADGKWIAFESTRGADESPSALWRVAAPGGK